MFPIEPIYVNCKSSSGLKVYLLLPPTQERLLLLSVCAPLFAGAHLSNGWLFAQMEISMHISWIYLPAFLRVAYVLVLGPVWGCAALFMGSMLLVGSGNENLLQASTNALASALGPILALWLFKVLKERPLQLSEKSDLIQLCLLYALLNALVHHAAWSLIQPDQLMAVSQMPVMVIGDLVGALLGALLFTLVMRRFGLYKVMARLSQDKQDPS